MVYIGIWKYKLEYIRMLDCAGLVLLVLFFAALKILERGYDE